MMPNRSCFLLTTLLALPSMAAAQAAQSTAGHARARQLAELGRLPTARDIVVRDIVNYHRHRLPLPRADQAIALDLRCDRNAAGIGDELVLQVGYTTKTQGDRALAPPTSVALVVDCSGSMQERGKMSQVHAGLRAFVNGLRRDDEIALVSFSSEARVVTPLRRRGDGAWLQDAIAQLHPDGNTNLEAGLSTGLRQLGDAAHQSRRVLLLTDGIANTGITDPDEILRSTARQSEAGIDVSTIGVGNNLDTALLQRLADGNRGLFHFVADERDVQKVFVRELECLLAPAARHVQLRVRVPDGLIIEQVYESRVRQLGDGNEVEIDLPDLNAGATGVVLLRCRVGRRLLETGRAEAELHFTDAQRGAPQQLAASTPLHPDGDGRDGIDLEVRKNFAIALLAEGLAEMARACDSRRWADADRSLRRAGDRAREVFPGDDEDLQRVRDIVAGHQRTLQRYVNRFRDY